MPVVRLRSHNSGGVGSGLAPDATMQAVLNGTYNGTTINYYTGSPPRSTADAAGTTFLGQHSLNYPPATTNDLITTSSTNLHVTGGFVYVDGTVGWARVRGPDGTAIFDGLVGLAGSGRPFIVNTTAWTTGMTITMTACTATTGT